jgi:phytoene desaturase
MKFVDLDPMYRLDFGDGQHIDISRNKEKMRAEIKRVYPGEEVGLEWFMATEGKRYRRLFPCLTKPYSNSWAYLRPVFIKAIPWFTVFPYHSLYDIMGDYFESDKLKLSFTFQSKYLGMSPWECPGAFGLIPFVEHEFGIYHVEGGLSEISKGMERAAVELGATIKKSTKVKRLIIEGKKVKGVELESGERVMADDVVVNADFGYAATKLMEGGDLKKWSASHLESKGYSCSIFMLYLGVDKLYEMPHHEIYYAKDYRKNLDDIFHGGVLSDDTSFYVRNASISDPTLAPAGKSALYVLVPVANTRAKIDWAREKKRFRDLVVKKMEERTVMKDLSSHIVAEHVITPDDWESKYNVYVGGVFNLAHSLDQMLAKRPHNQFEELENCYLVGGGTHPGSGLPTIYESGKISAKLIADKHGLA